MATVINPKVQVIDYGPVSYLPDGGIITPDEWIYGASQVTYKDVRAMEDMQELRASDPAFRENLVKSLIGSAGRGHASMTTSSGLWIAMQGHCSKLVDAAFTGASFGSSLMPSGRRVGIDREQIVFPAAIARSPLASRIYEQASLRNIQVYEAMQAAGVDKQEAAKIVQYGHRGGGFMFVPLETVIGFIRESENFMSRTYLPEEFVSISSQIADFAKEHGMDIIYEARKAAARSCYPNRNIFHNRSNSASERAENNTDGVLDAPVQIGFNFESNPAMLERIREYLTLREQSTRSIQATRKDWKSVMWHLEKVVEDYPFGASLRTAANISMRVWGEVKRHRTMPQVTESVYHGAQRALKAVDEFDGDYSDLYRVKFHFGKVVSIPKSVFSNPESLKTWIGTFSGAMRAYRDLTEIVDPKDAVMVIPRGIKMVCEKEFDFFNLALGYMPLRLCSTAEPEMRSITKVESQFISKSDSPDEIKALIGPKCHAVGFCLEPGKTYEKCRAVNAVAPTYTIDEHKILEAKRVEEVRASLLPGTFSKA